MTSQISLCQSSLELFKRVSRYYCLFHLVFILVVLLELVSFLLFFSFFARSAFLGISIGVIFFTGFAYCVLHFYFQGKRPEEFAMVKENYLQSCKKVITHPSHSSEYQLSLASHIYQLVDAVQEGESPFYPFPPSLDSLGAFLEKLGMWTYQSQAHQMKEILLLEAVGTQLELIKSHPTDIQKHASLAQAYRTLAQIYLKIPTEEGSRRFSFYMKLALEEFKIISHFSPDSPWAHSELAATYHVLKQPDLEREHYQKLHHMLPEDQDILLRLGTLYFEQGERARALLIYEELRALSPSYAERLIAQYVDFSRL